MKLTVILALAGGFAVAAAVPLAVCPVRTHTETRSSVDGEVLSASAPGPVHLRDELDWARSLVGLPTEFPGVSVRLGAEIHVRHQPVWWMVIAHWAFALVATAAIVAGLRRSGPSVSAR